MDNRYIDLSDATIAGLASALKGPVQTTYTAQAPGVEDRLDNLYDAVNSVASKLDSNARNDMASAALFANAVTEMKTTISGNRGRGNDDKNSDKSVGYLRNISSSTRQLLDRSQNCGIEVSICNISANAMKDITNAVRAVKGTINTSNPIGSVTKERRPGQRMSKVFDQSIDDLGDQLSVANRSSGSGGHGRNGPMGPGGAGQAGNSLKSLATGVEKLGYGIAMVGKIASDAFSLNMFNILPNVKAANAWRENIRQLAFQTQGYVKDNKELASTYFDLVKNANAAGTTLEEFQKHLLMSTERGLNRLSRAEKKAFATRNKHLKGDRLAAKIRNIEQRKTINVTTSALNTAQMLRMEVGATNDLFTQWHMQLGMSANQMATIGQHMQKVARSSGVTGSELQEAMKSADRLAKLLKSAGAFDVGTAKNITELTTLYQKYGVGDQMSAQLEARTSRNAFMDATPQTKWQLTNIAAQGGGEELVNKVQFGGSFDSRKDQKSMAEGRVKLAQDVLAPYTQQLIRSGALQQGQSVRDLDLTKISAAMKKLRTSGNKEQRMAGQQAYGVIDQRMRQQLGGGTGDVERAIKAEQELLKPTHEALKDLQKEINDNTRLFGANSKAVKESSRRMQALKTSKFEDMFSTLDEAVQSTTGGFNELMAGGPARQRLLAELTDMHGASAANKFINDLGGSAKSLTDNFDAQAKTMGTSLEELLNKQGFEGGTSRLKNMLTSGKQDQITAAMTTLKTAQQDMGTKERVSMDPATAARNIIERLHNRGQGAMEDGMAYIVDWLGKEGMLIVGALTGVGTVIAGGAGLLGSALIGGGGLLGGGQLLKGILGKIGGASKAAGGASKAAGVASKAAGGASKAAGGASKAASKAAGVVSKASKAAGGIFGKILAPLQLALGGLTGALEAKEAGRTTGEGATFGILTGGANTGSMFSGMLGIEKGSTGDKALGVGGAAAYGAMAGGGIGALLAPITGGLSIPIGAAIGALVSAAMELLKIFTEGTDYFNKYFMTPLKIFTGPFVSQIMGPLKMIKSLFTGDMNGFIDGLTDMFLSVPKMIGKGLVWLVEDIFGTDLTDTLKPLKEGWNEMTKAMSEVWGAVKEALGLAGDDLWSTLKSGLSDLGKFLKPVAEVISGFLIMGIESLVKSLKVLVPWIKFGAVVIGGFLKGLIQGVKNIYGFISSIVNGIISPFKYLYDVLVGHSIIPDLVFGIIKFFAMLPIKTMRALGGLVKDLGIWIWQSISSLPKLILDGISSALIGAWTRFTDFTGEGAVKAVRSEMDKKTVKQHNEITADQKTIETKSGSSKVKELEKQLIAARKKHVTAESNVKKWEKKVGTDTKWYKLNDLNTSRKESVARWEGAKTDSIGASGRVRSLEIQLNKAREEIDTETKGVSSPVEKGAFAKGGGKEAGSEALSKSMKEQMEIKASVDKWNAERGLTDTIKKKEEERKKIKTLDVSLDNKGAFIKGGGKEAVSEALSKNVKDQGDASTHDVYVEAALLKILAVLSNKPKSTVADPLNTGAFSKENIFDAKSESVAEYVARVTASNSSSDSLSKSFASKNNQSSSAQSKNDYSSSSSSDGSSSSRQNIISSLARTMDLLESSGYVEDLRTSRTGEANSTSLDYSQETKGVVNTLLTNRSQIESEIERRRLGESTGSSSMIPGMNEIGSYLVGTQAEKLTRMIDLLSSINAKVGSNSGGGSDVIGPNGKKQRHLQHGGVDISALAQVNPRWGITFSDAQAGDITTEGNGPYG